MADKKRQGYFYKTEDDIITAVAFIYENAKENSIIQLAEKLGTTSSVIIGLIQGMRKEGLEVKTSGIYGRYKSVIHRWVSDQRTAGRL